MADQTADAKHRGVDMIAGFEEHLRELDRAESTIEAYIETLRKMDQELPAGLLSATDAELRTWIYRRDWSKSTRHLRRSIARTFFGYATDPTRHPHLDYNPAAHLPPVTVPAGHARPAPTEVLRVVLATAPEPFLGWFWLASHAGARCVEIAAMDRDDIREDLTVLHGKGSRDRLVPTHELVWAWAQKLPPGPVAPGEKGGRLNRRQVSSRGNRQLDVMGFGWVSMHMLRHWFGTEAYDAVGDLVAVQELLGHASPSTTRVYVAVSRRRMTQAVRGLRSVSPDAPVDAPAPPAAGPAPA